MMYPPSGTLPSATHIAKAIRSAQVDCVTLLPRFLEEIAADDELLDAVSGSI